jgi:hypothetical protein
MAPPELLSSSDAIATLSGEDIPSEYADEDATYLHDRKIAALREVGAIADASDSLAARADGIIDALPADGRLDVEELVRMEEPPYVDALFPEERAALPQLWALMEVPAVAPVQFAFDPLPRLEIEDRTIDPTGLDYPVLSVEEFPAEVHNALRRVQRLHDHDGNDTTVAREDLMGALDSPGPFSAEELQQVEAALALQHERATSPLSAITAVTAPGVSESETTLDGLTLARLTEITLREEREFEDRNGSNYRYRVAIELAASTTTHPVLADEQRLLLVHTGLANDHAYEDDRSTTEPGLHLVETYEDGVRVDVMWAELPSLGPATSSIDLSDRAGHRFEALDGTPLHQNLRDVGYEWRPSTDLRSRTYAEYTWDDAVEPSTEDTTDRLGETRLPFSTLPPGRYATSHPDGGELFLDVFPEGAFRMVYGDTSAWARPGGEVETSALRAYRLRAPLGDQEVTFATQDGTLSVNMAVRVVHAATLVPADRIQ